MSEIEKNDYSSPFLQLFRAESGNRDSSSLTNTSMVVKVQTHCIVSAGLGDSKRYLTLGW